MPKFIRLSLWPPGFLPRRLAAPAVRSSHPDPASLAPKASVEIPTSSPGVLATSGTDSPVSMGERRAAALRTMFPMLFSMHARRADLWQAIAIERHLSQAKDIIDLERRIREVERRRPLRWSE